MFGISDLYAILDSLSEIIYIVDIETNKILYSNRASKDIFGDCTGKTYSQVYLGAPKENNGDFIKKLNEDSFYTWTHTSETNGKTYMLRDKIINWNGKKAIMEIASDVTVSTNKQRDLENRLDMEHFIVSCIIEMHKNKPFEESFNNLLKMTGKFLDADRVYVFDSSDDHNVSNEWCRDGVESKINIIHDLDKNLTEKWIQSIREKNCIIIDDIELIKESVPEDYKLLSTHGIKRLITAPLENDGELTGYIGADNIPKENMHESEVLFVALCYFISSMIIKEKNERKLREMSYTDTLTGLNNRNKFIYDTDKMAERHFSGFGVVYMDLNGLKSINDKQGHFYGDNALKIMAQVITDVFGKDNSYRVGGDEFVVICLDITEDDFNKKIDELAQAFDKIDCSAAIGWQYSNEPSRFDDIIKTADEKMYLDKKFFYRNSKESSRYRFRNDTFAAISTPDLLKKLINEERFVIWFQPRFDTETGDFSGSEALVRFFDEDDVIVSPMDFIPEMEDNETIHLIDLYVFRHVCEYVSGWINSGKIVKPVSVNISHKTMMKSNFIENIMDIWYDYKVPKELIIIEVSEDQERGGIAKIVNILSDLKKFGFKIAIDNFGSKYADLYLFADLKFDILKLDGDMVYKIETDSKTHFLSNSIAQICHSENIRIVAEGVENESEYETLKRMGCNEVQGYLFDKPMSWNKFEDKYLQQKK